MQTGRKCSYYCCW